MTNTHTHTQPLTVKQIKRIQSLIDAANEQCHVELKACEMERSQHLIQIGNILHPSVPISDNEVGQSCNFHARNDFSPF